MNLLRPTCRLLLQSRAQSSILLRTMSTSKKPRKPGVATDEEMQAFLSKNSTTSIVVVDARNKDFSVEPGDQKHASNIAGNPPLIHTDEYFAQYTPEDRPNAINLPYDRTTKSMDLTSGLLFFDGTDMLKEKGKHTPINDSHHYPLWWWWTRTEGKGVLGVSGFYERD